MKTVFASLLIALTAATSFAGTTSGDANGSATFQSSVYVNQSGDLKVAVDKEKGQPVSVLLTMPNGQVIASERVSKNRTALRARFDIKNLEDGQYMVKITDGKTIKEQQIMLKTEAPIQLTNRTVSIF